MGEQADNPDHESRPEIGKALPDKSPASASEAHPNPEETKTEASPSGSDSEKRPGMTESDGGNASDATQANEPPPAGWYADPNSSGNERYWNGSKWTNEIRATVSTTRRSPDERKALLAQQVQQAITRGLRVESQSDFQAVLIEGKPVNHTLHAILTIFTCLAWGLVWAVIAGTGGEKREMILIDEFGNVQHQKLGKA